MKKNQFISLGSVSVYGELSQCFLGYQVRQWNDGKGGSSLQTAGWVERGQFTKAGKASSSGTNHILSSMD